MVSATHTNITPAKLEEFEATFKHFDKDDTNVSPGGGVCDSSLMLDLIAVGDAFRTGESGYCLCGMSLSLTFEHMLTTQDEEIEVIYTQMEEDFGAVTYEAWLALLVS